MSLAVHRYVGLLMSVFLILAGVTGCIIAFYPQLDRQLNPELLQVTPPHEGARELAPLTVRQRLVEQIGSDESVDGAVLFRWDGLPYNYWLDGREVFVDPYTGKIRGSRKFGDLSEGRKGFMTFLYEFHFTLGIGDVGAWMMGIVALLWTVDCFFGAYLTFPPPSRLPGSKRRHSWLTRWAPAWAIKTTKLFSLVFTWHRASGLWVWGFLLVFAWSAVALNLRDEVYKPTMTTLFGEGADVHDRLPQLKGPRTDPQLRLEEAYRKAKEHMSTLARERGFDVIEERYLYYESDHGAYAFTVESSEDISSRLAETTLYIDGNTGAPLALHLPDNSHTGTTISRWLIALHFGAINLAGLAYRIFVCVLGLLVAVLSLTGVWIWWRKKNKRQQKRLAP